MSTNDSMKKMLASMKKEYVKLKVFIPAGQKEEPVTPDPEPDEVTLEGGLGFADKELDETMRAYYESLEAQDRQNASGSSGSSAPLFKASESSQHGSSTVRLLDSLRGL